MKQEGETASTNSKPMSETSPALRNLSEDEEHSVTPCEKTADHGLAAGEFPKNQ
jgi:hypothetical protein